MTYDPRAAFSDRVAALPRLGLGVSTEFGAAAHGLDVLALRADRPDLLGFLEVGIDLDRGADATASAWVATGGATTQHFLDLNLEEEADLDPAWIAETLAWARRLGAAWLCGDAGLWHVGPRDRGHGTLLAPVLTAASARAMAASVRALREATGLEVLPENAPAHVYLGDLPLLDYLASVAEQADAGLLLDVAHLAIYQRASGRAPLDGLTDFPLDRVVEIHVAGGTEFTHAGRVFVDDDHGPEPLPDTWKILDWVLPRAPNLRALVYECERNPRPAVLATFEQLADRLDAMPALAAAPASRCDARPPLTIGAAAVGRIQRTLFRMQHDAAFAARLRAADAEARASTGLDDAGLATLFAADPAAIEADREGRRAAQLLRNVSSEFPLSTALGPGGDGDAGFVAGFPASARFHAAIAGDASLPLAFAAWLEELARDARSGVFRAFVALESALARARREERTAPALERGALALDASACLVALPAGTHAAAAAQAGSTPRAVDAAARETLLVQRRAPAALRFGRLPELRVEPLEPLVAEFLRRAQRPLDAAVVAAFAAEHDVEPEALDAVVAEFVADGVLAVG